MLLRLRLPFPAYQLAGTLEGHAAMPASWLDLFSQGCAVCGCSARAFCSASVDSYVGFLYYSASSAEASCRPVSGLQLASALAQQLSKPFLAGCQVGVRAERQCALCRRLPCPSCHFQQIRTGACRLSFTPLFPVKLAPFLVAPLQLHALPISIPFSLASYSVSTASPTTSLPFMQR